MKILLLTDFHFKSSKSEELNQNQAVADIIQVLHKKEIKPEYIFFAGDLVFSGDKLEDFTLAKQCVLDPLLKALDLTNEQLFICPGNHDVARSGVSKSIVRNITSFVNDEELEKFYKDNDLDYKNSLLPLANYRNFVSTELSYKEGMNHYTDFYTVHIRRINNQSIGIVCANTSWRAVGPDDDHNLVIPVSAMREAAALIKGCEIKLLMQHHPSIDLKDYNRRSFEDLAHSQFNVSFSGHFHEEEKQVFLTNNNGIVKISGAAMYAPNDGSQRGFTYIDVNPNDWIATCTSYYYDLKTKIYFDGSTKQVDIPVDESKSEQNKLRKKLRDKYAEEVENANDLFLNGRSRVGAESFLQIWTPPVLSSKHSEQEDEIETAQFSINTLLKHEQAYLVLGKDKCGKTSLLTKILLDSLDEFATKDVIPILINFKSNSYVVNSAEEMPRILSRYYEINRTAALNLLENKKTLLLIDNCRIDDDRHTEAISKLLKTYPLMNALICADETISSRVREFQFGGRDIQKIYFRGLKSRQIRELAEKVYGVKAQGQIEIVKRIKNIFSTLNIPYNFWNVSLFMYVFKDGGGNISNDVELVDLYIESILERKELIIRKASFGFEDYKIYLANLAKFFYDKETQDYSATHREIIDFTDEYLHKNPRNNIDSKAVWEYLEERGIWRSYGSNMYTFRLSPVFEYFVSVYLKQDGEFRHQIVYDDTRYLSFANEFEMYAGANRRDEKFLEDIYLRTQIVFEELHKEFQDTILDKQLQAAALEMDSLINKIDLERIREMNQEERDNLDDKIAIEQAGGFDRTSEVKVKERLPLDSTQIDSLERALQILGRVYKNANGIDTNRELVYSVFDYLIDTMCKFGFKIFQEVRDSDMVSSLEKEKAETILKLLTQFLPVLAETRMSSILGTNNFELMIIERLKSLKRRSFDEVTHVSSNENQFKVFILCFLLADINLVKHHNRIEECISYITIGVLKHCMIIKIVHYIHFAVAELPSPQQANIKSILQEYFAKAKGKFDKPNNNVMSDSLQKISNRQIIIKDKNSR